VELRFYRLPRIVQHHLFPFKMCPPLPLHLPELLFLHLIPSLCFISSKPTSKKLRPALRHKLCYAARLMLFLPPILRTSFPWLETRSIFRLHALICFSKNVARRLAAMGKILQMPTNFSRFGKLTDCALPTNCCFSFSFATGDHPSRLQILLTSWDTWLTLTPGLIFSRRRLSFKTGIASASSSRYCTSTRATSATR
jgi:hypothetical protein